MRRKPLWHKDLRRGGGGPETQKKPHQRLAAINSAVVVLALLGSFLVSYIRSKAEGLGAECNVGIATRAERVVLLAIGLIAGLLTQAIYLIAFLTAVTVVQRVLLVRQELRTDR